jgi:hypothetical protein
MGALQGPGVDCGSPLKTRLSWEQSEKKHTPRLGLWC